MGLRQRFVRLVYARHNRSPSVRRVLGKALAALERSGGYGLDLGCGENRLHPRLLRLDLAGDARPDCRASAERLPFRDGVLTVVVSQEVLEHLPDPSAALSEINRVLAPGGLLYLQAPFVIGQHDAPRDYWRFTGDGLALVLRKAGLEPGTIEPAAGAGTGLYRIGVEFFAVLASALSRSMKVEALSRFSMLCGFG